jgi:hypothetical protein
MRSIKRLRPRDGSCGDVARGWWSWCARSIGRGHGCRIAMQYAAQCRKPPGFRLCAPACGGIGLISRDTSPHRPHATYGAEWLLPSLQFLSYATTVTPSPSLFRTHPPMAGTGRNSRADASSSGSPASRARWYALTLRLTLGAAQKVAPPALLLTPNRGFVKRQTRRDMPATGGFRMSLLLNLTEMPRGARSECCSCRLLCPGCSHGGLNPIFRISPTLFHQSHFDCA